MKTKIAVIVSLVATLNLGNASSLQAEVIPSAVVKEDFRANLIAKSNQQKLKKVVSYIKSRANKTAYVFSGSTIQGWDCSGLVRYTYKRLGITIPHSANKQGHLGKRVSKPKIGDIVVFAYKGSTDFYHSAIYLGQGQIINANRYYRTTVIQPLSDFKNSQIRFIRLL
jgi:cell wall-associated NlpC family hydrolase